MVPPEEEEAQADAVKEIFKVRCPGGRGEDMRNWEWFGCCLAVRAASSDLTVAFSPCLQEYRFHVDSDSDDDI